MKLRAVSLLNVGLALLPAVLLGLLMPFLFVSPESAIFYQSYITLLIAGGVTVSIYALTLAVIALRSARRVHEISDDRNILKRRNRALDGHVQTLESEVELLTAMREVSRIVSDEVRFEKLVTSVLQVISELTDADEVTLFLLDDAGEKLVPRANRKGGKTRVGKDLSGFELDAKYARRALDHAVPLRTLDMGVLDIIVPLASDQQPLGVLNIRAELAGDADEKTERADYIDFVLRDISRHVGLAIKMAALHARAVHDAGTGLYNKGHFLRSLDEAVAESRRNDTPLSLIMLDIDHFKVINDTFGHPAGDRVLTDLSARLMKNLRKTDTAYRYGGEEVAVLLPGAPIRAACRLAERLREAVAESPFRGNTGDPVDVRISLGVAELAGGMNSPDDLVSLADSALYEAKRTGRNRVCPS
ncbi:MAG TPA: diguanylate cyclase, partial [Planctomycetota bacterium]|nr:diguanylate cyclase [Planctomycetota bacterium]